MRTACLAAIVPLLTACANFGPGMHLDDPAISDRSPQPLPAIRVITADLIAEERALRLQQPAPDVAPLIGVPHPYAIGTGDVLSVMVWNYPELSTLTQLPLPSAVTGATGLLAPAPGFVVDTQGMIQFPYIGPVKVAGLTEMQARELLGQKLTKVVKRPDMTVRIINYRSKRIYLDGALKQPGYQIIDDVPMTLLEGINRAGGFLPTADQSLITVSRGGKLYRVDLAALEEHGIDPSPILLVSGDVVRVHASDENKVFVLGEVVAPRALAMTNGRMTLNQALGESGGLNPLTSEARQVYVIRNTTAGTPTVYNLDAQSPVALALAENFQLRPRDVVYVDTAPLARFNRVLGLILPVAAGLSNSYKSLQ
jgi:polysaccharide export outer membrane protein